MSEWPVSADMLTRPGPYPEARRDNDREKTVNAIQAWLAEHGVEYVETFVSDFAGVARGKIQPAAELGDKAVKLPIAIFGQTVTGTYHMRRDNARDRDMDAIPDPSTLRLMLSTNASALLVSGSHIPDTSRGYDWAGSM